MFICRWTNFLTIAKRNHEHIWSLCELNVYGRNKSKISECILSQMCQNCILKRQDLASTSQLRFYSTERKYDFAERLKTSQLDMAKQRLRDLRANIFTVPNLLSASRLLSAPVIAYLVVNGNFPPALALFALAGVTDLLDGFIARLWPSQTSALGSVLDPAADKFLVASLFLALTYATYVPVPLTILVVSRDFGLILYTMYKRYEMLEPPKTFVRYWDPTASTANIKPTAISKWNTAIQLTFCASVLCAASLGTVPTHPALLTFAWITAASTCASGFSYFIAKDTIEIVKKSGTGR